MEPKGTEFIIGLTEDALSQRHLTPVGSIRLRFDLVLDLQSQVIQTPGSEYFFERLGCISGLHHEVQSAFHIVLRGRSCFLEDVKTSENIDNAELLMG